MAKWFGATLAPLHDALVIFITGRTLDHGCDSCRMNKHEWQILYVRGKTPNINGVFTSHNATFWIGCPTILLSGENFRPKESQ